MKIYMIGDNYKSYFASKLKKYNYIDGQDGFNLSMCRIDNANYLFCVRMLGTIQAYFGEKIIPGNFSNKKLFMENKAKSDPEIILENISFGQNFFWNSWGSNLIDNSIFFVGKLKKNKIIVNENILPYVIHNEKIKLSSGVFTSMSDIRIIKVSNKMYYYDGNLSGIYEIKVNNNKIVMARYNENIINNLYVNKNICLKAPEMDNNNIAIPKPIQDNIHVKLYDKNWAFIDIINKYKTECFVFLNWFLNKSVKITYVPLNKNKLCFSENIIKMNGDIIDGLGTNDMPMFSLGTPCFKLDDNNYIGAGHVKIIRTKKYENKKINKFINFLNSDKNYIHHNSYFYLVFYYILTMNNYKLMISNSFIYANTTLKNLYKFSIFFPMGIDVKNNKVIISSGYGDYYNCIIKYKLKNLIKMCKHDVSNLNIKKYKFIVKNSEFIN